MIPSPPRSHAARRISARARQDLAVAVLPRPTQLSPEDPSLVAAAMILALVLAIGLPVVAVG